MRKITRWTWAPLPLVLFVTFAATDAGAGGKARRTSDPTGAESAQDAINHYNPAAPETEVKYVNGLFSSYIADAVSYQEKFVKAQVEGSTAAAAEAQKARADVLEKQTRLNEALTRANREIAQKRTDLEGLKTEQARIEAEQKRELLPDMKEKQGKQIQDLVSRQNKLNGEIQAQEKSLQGLSGQLGAASSSVDNQFNNVYQPAVSKLQEKLSDQGRAALELQGFSTGVENMFQKLKLTGYDAKMLLMDLDSIKTHYKLDDIQLAELQRKFLEEKNGSRMMDNTLIGRYVNAQIEKAMASRLCEMQNKCLKGQTPAMIEAISGRLDGGRPADVVGSDGENAKPQEAPKAH